jgi:arylsulfatase A-like enzyme
VAPGARLPVQVQVDVAPTIARLLGIAPPRDAVGRPIAALLPARAPARPVNGRVHGMLPAASSPGDHGYNSRRTSTP